MTGPPEQTPAKTRKEDAPLPDARPHDAAPIEMEGRIEGPVRRGVLVFVEGVSFVGPLPPPELLGAYDKILPGLAERIVLMAEKEQSQRHELGDRILKIESRNSLWGLIFAFVIGMTGIVGGLVVAASGVPWPGAVVSGAALASLVGTFVYGTRSRREQIKEQMRLLASSDSSRTPSEQGEG
jgi:uncharacterized membrane protein